MLVALLLCCFAALDDSLSVCPIDTRRKGGKEGGDSSARRPAIFTQTNRGSASEAVGSRSEGRKRRMDEGRRMESGVSQICTNSYEYEIVSLSSTEFLHELYRAGEKLGEGLWSE